MTAARETRRPMVSVAMITYNQDKYIAQAIEGVLGQDANFPCELVIGEDASSDDTRRICLEYEAQHPDVIRVLRHPHNLGMQRNFMTTIHACEGKYVALCEGDDYWTDATKLQRQIDFLEANPDFAVCHHRLRIVVEDGSKQTALSPHPLAEETTFEDLARSQHIATASCVFRNKLFEFPEVFLKVYGTDYMLNLLNARHGKIKFIDEVMGVYRVQHQGEWSGRTGIERGERALDTIRKCREYFQPRASGEFDFHVAKLECFLMFERQEFGDFRRASRALVASHRRFLSVRNWLALGARYVVSPFPPLTTVYRHLSGRM